MKRVNLWLPMLTILLLSCSPSPKKINYGSDMCHYCKMTIVDQRHAAQLVTAKGKVTNYDAIECMINHINSQVDLDLAFTLVNDFLQPSILMDAHTSYYLISEAIPSPMGAFLSAFSDEKEAEKVRKSKGGKIYNWQEIKQYISTDLSIEN